MPSLRNALLAGAAAVVLSTSGMALAQTSDTHLMTVRLPDGGIAQIRYTGDVPPQVSVSPASVTAPLFLPTALFGPASPFTMLDRISAEMHREAAALFRQAEALTASAQTGQPVEVSARNLSPGSRSFTFISTLSGNGFCSRSTEVTSLGNGAPPKVVTHSSGNCAPAAETPGSGAAGSINLPTVPTPANRPDALWVSNQGKPSYSGLVRPADWQR